MADPINRRRLLAGLLLTPGILAACSAEGPILPDLPIATTEYLLGHGDRMSVTIFGQPELSGEHVVDGAGNISMPLIGAVAAGGRTASELETRIAELLQPDYLNDPQVSVQVLGYRPFYILGEVRRPGSYPYVDGMVITNAIALAGGFTYRAREDTFFITRNIDPERHRRLADRNAPVLPGDVVTVRERYF